MNIEQQNQARVNIKRLMEEQGLSQPKLSVFTQIDRAHRKFSDEQIKNLGIIGGFKKESDNVQYLFRKFLPKVIKNDAITIKQMFVYAVNVI